MRATADLTKAFLSPLADCLAPVELNTPCIESPNNILMTLTASFILLATETACLSCLANPPSFTHNRHKKGTN
jgi:hypothetical protein